MGKKYIDLSKLSEQIGCVFKDVEVKPGVVIRQTHWTKADYQTAKAAIREEMDADPDASFAIYGSPDPWNTVALVKELGVRYVYPWPEHPEKIELDLSPLPVGLPKDNYDVRFEIREEGERLFLNMTSDNPDLPRGEGTPHRTSISTHGACTASCAPWPRLWRKAPEAYSLPATRRTISAAPPVRRSMRSGTEQRAPGRIRCPTADGRKGK